MNLSRDVLSMLRFNDTDFYHLLITCKSLYRYFEYFATDNGWVLHFALNTCIIFANTAIKTSI